MREGEVMAIPFAEIEARQRAVQQVLETDDLQAILLIGDTSVNYAFCGDLRYFTNNRIVFYRQVVVLFPRSEPVMFVESTTQKRVATRRSLIKDCRVSSSFLTDIAELLKINTAAGVAVQWMFSVLWIRF